METNMIIVGVLLVVLLIVVGVFIFRKKDHYTPQSTAPQTTGQKREFVSIPRPSFSDNTFSGLGYS